MSEIVNPLWGVPPQPEELFIGVDLGQARDWTAFVLASRTKTPQGNAFAVDHLERWRELKYTKIVELVRDRVTALNVWPPQGGPKPRITVAVDFTGPGRPVADMFAAADLGATLELITITGGDNATRGEAGDWRVPKRDLAAVVQIALQDGRLKFANALPLTETLVQELQNFRVKISLSGHDSYGAGADWRDGNHDDLVLATALAVWAGENEAGGWEAIPADLIQHFFALGL